MKTINTRFGEVQYDPSSVIHFPEGLVGLDQLKNFLVMPNEKKGPLFWIQSVDDPAFAFVVTDPTNFFLDYAVLPDEKERQKLGIDENGACFVLAIVTVTQDKQITLNLSGPILYAPESRKGIQVVLEDPRYDIRTPLPKVEKE
ncbi:flagellar assembly protein FliW [Desulfobulbus rhabdoformis]|uniref:flagellar assembly protein FliW n=1 Tax=Desulfobulbus rhabdoformis TaxID=34032 RepID=UPI0019657949|nr:flagellar assembly protein FliW [Desulfobulbus rhabdoformis]MBM9616510.1 flagellar assembly protein FliW [Desulfobulbus rhabdoformis]